jgi:hypothetical protein
MNKSKLTRFISKYHLGGTVNSVILNSKNNKLSTRFISGDKSLLGELSMENWDFEDSTLGVYDTEKLVKLLSVLDEDVSMSVVSTGEKSIQLKVSDSSTAVTYMLSDTTVINEPPDMKQIPEFQLNINLTSQFIKKFLAGDSALSESETFTVMSDGVDTNVVINYASVNTNRVNIPVTTSRVAGINNVSFKSKFFSEILRANGECTSASFEVAEDGLSRLKFKVDDYDVTYYVVAVQDVD